MRLTETIAIKEQARNSLYRRRLVEGLSAPHVQMITESEQIANKLNRLIMEADLTADQINQLFGAVEQNATAAGGNRTAIGKSKDVVDAVNDIINRTGKLIQDTAPVQAFDQKFEQLKGAVSEKFPELDAQLTSLGTWAKENPGKTAAIVGVLTVLGGIAGGPVGGAIAGQALRGSVELIKGEKLSTAIGKGAKTAAIGALTGFALEKVKELVADLLPADISTTFFNPQQGTIDVSKLKGMGIVDPANLDPEAAVELIQARSGLAELVRVPDMPPEAKEELMKQLQEVNTKLVELGGGANVKDAIDNLQSNLDITGSGIEVQTTTATDAASGSTASMEVTGEIDASTLDSIGINSADFSPNKWISDNKDALLKYMDQEQLDAWQNASALSRSINSREFEGVAIAASNEFTTSNMGNIDVSGIPDSVEVGEVYRSTVNTEIGGVPWTASADVSIEGVDAAGNAVYKFSDVFTNPSAIKADMWDALEGMPKELQDELLGQFDGITKGSATVVADTAAQDIANGIMQGVVAAGVGATMADADIKDAEGKKAKAEESVQRRAKIREATMRRYFTSVTYNHNNSIQQINEGPMDALKNLGAKLEKGATAALQKAGTIGKNITTKITVDKLMKAWNKAGKPFDDAAISKILVDMGVDPAIISTSYKAAGLTEPTAASAAPSVATGTAQVGDTVTYTNAKGQQKQAKVAAMLNTKDAQGDPQIQLQIGGAKFAVDQKSINSIDAKAPANTKVADLAKSINANPAIKQAVMAVLNPPAAAGAA